jgi:glycine betaine catabolism B
MASVRRILGEVGYDMRKYHEESFSFDGLPASDVPPPLDGAEQSAMPAGVDGTVGSPAAGTGKTSYSVEFVRSGLTVTCGADENVLDAAFAASVRLPASCTQGMCGTCKTTMLSGEVDMQHNGGIRPREVAQDKILLCCSKPLSDLRIDS